MRKYTRDDIARAYNTFDLPLGTALVEVMVKYRKLAPDMHPDRFFDPAQKKKAEEKLKKLNHAKDVLSDHFKGPRASHVEGATCACKPAKAATFNLGSEQAARERQPKRLLKKPPRKLPRTLSKKRRLKEKAAEKLRAEKRAAAAEAALKAAQAAAEAERLAAVAAAAAKEAAETVQADASHEQRKQSEAARWRCAKVCASIFLSVMTFAGAADLVKGPGHRDHTVLSITPSPATSPSETKEQEDSFYRMEADRSTSDEKHRYDAEVDQCLNQISDDEKQIRAWQQELDKLKKEPEAMTWPLYTLCTKTFIQHRCAGKRQATA